MDVCILTNRYIKEHQINTIETAVREADMNIRLVVVNEPRNPDLDSEAKSEAVNNRIGKETVRLFIKMVRRERWWSLVIAEKKISELLGSDAADFTLVPVNNIGCFREAEIKRVTPIEDGAWSEIPPDAVTHIANNCDVVIRYGFGLLRGDVLNAPEFGVLSFHPADIRKYRGLGPPKVWLDNRELIGVTLQRITDSIDSGEIVAYDEVKIDDCKTLWEVYERVHDAEAELLSEGIKLLRDRPTEVIIPESLGSYYSTSLRQKLSFSGRILFKNTKGRIRRWIGNKL
jgi:hypothetical protein